MRELEARSLQSNLEKKKKKKKKQISVSHLSNIGLFLLTYVTVDEQVLVLYRK
jgi:hypothetical protein